MVYPNGLLNGDGTNFNPEGNASRAQAATLCMRTDEAVDTWYQGLLDANTVTEGDTKFLRKDIVLGG